MKIKFLKPVVGFSYFENDISAELANAAAAQLVADGFAIIIPDTEGEENTLPDGLPAREILFNAGLETITDVKNALPTITDIQGIGKTTAANIQKFINKL